VAQVLQTAFDYYGVKAAALDFLFPEPDRTSPENAAELWKLPPARRTVLAGLPRHDEILARTIARYPVAIGNAFNFEPESTHRASTALHPAAGLSGNGDFRGWLPEAPNVTRNLAVLERSARGIAHINMLPEVDSVVRAVPSFVQYKNEAYPT